MGPPRRRRSAAAAALALALGTGCAGPATPWHVPRGEEARFREAERVCRQLTDDDGGVLSPERHEACMERRGWRHENLLERLF